MPNINLHAIEGDSFFIGTMKITPIPVFHGKLPVMGYRIGSFAYITDCSQVPPSSLPLLAGVSHLVIGALRYRSHETHFSIPEALDFIKKISPERAYLTHICHDVEHFKLKEELSDMKVEPAYDGQIIAVTL